MESLRLSARLSGYVDAIKEARAAGVTWQQLGDLYGARGKTMAAAFKVAASGKYSAREQKPLPIIATIATPIVRQRAAVAHNEEQPPDSNKRKLPRVGSSSEVNDEDEDGMTEAQRVLASIPRIGG